MDLCTLVFFTQVRYVCFLMTYMAVEACDFSLSTPVSHLAICSHTSLCMSLGHFLPVYSNVGQIHSYSRSHRD